MIAHRYGTSGLTASYGAHLSEVFGAIDDAFGVDEIDLMDDDDEDEAFGFDRADMDAASEEFRRVLGVYPGTVILRLHTDLGLESNDPRIRKATRKYLRASKRYAKSTGYPDWTREDWRDDDDDFGLLGIALTKKAKRKKAQKQSEREVTRALRTGAEALSKEELLRRIRGLQATAQRDDSPLARSTITSRLKILKRELRKR